MGVHIELKDLGQLRTELTHGPSGQQLQTDAPLDNAGKGECFSPTDLVAAAYLSCAVTTMGIKAPHEGIPFSGASGRVEKRMTQSGPRSIAQLDVVIRMSAALSADHRARLEEIARRCPVALSLGADVQIQLEFEYV